MKVLVLNCGSSSVRYQLFDMNDESVLAKGMAEKIHESNSIFVHKVAGREDYEIHKPIATHYEAIVTILETLVSDEHGVIKSLLEIEGIGHRIVHGGTYFKEATLVTSIVLEAIRDLIELAPLHNHAALYGMKACLTAMPNTPMVAVFDTAFHSTIPARNYLYGVPYEYYLKHGIRRYGFHGTSHRYVYGRLTDYIGNDKKVITCHLGSGASIAAIDKGSVIDTTMGFTPLAGLLMGTRCGDIDPSIVTYVMDKERLTPTQMDEVMNKKSGLLGISGVSNDLREVERAAFEEGNERARLAIEVFRKSVIRYIGAFSAEMKGVDAIAFCAGIGENSISTRKEICESLAYLGIDFDAEANNVRGVEREITLPGSKVRVFIIPTNEELMIARDVCAILGK
ncbi:MAG: acetate kinase [Firmicutes bacterium]|nr:acetate kinase [Bacillota bacterium]